MRTLNSRNSPQKQEFQSEENLGRATFLTMTDFMTPLQFPLYSPEI